jgi:polyhydroxybutyrate depolymerase
VGTGKSPEEALFLAWRRELSTFSARPPDGWVVDEAMSMYLWVRQGPDGRLLVQGVPRGTTLELNRRVRDNWSQFEVRRLKAKIESLATREEVSRITQSGMARREKQQAIETMLGAVVESKQKLRAMNQRLRTLEHERSAIEAARLGVNAQNAPSPTQLISPPVLTPETQQLVSERPYRLVVPPGYSGQPLPLVILLHGYSGSGQAMDDYLNMSSIAATRTFLLVTPDGTVDAAGYRYWNATDACCAANAPVPADDVAYLTAVIEDVTFRYSVDPQRVYIIGHSNGGFMAHRMACDRASRVAAIVSIAGAQWSYLPYCQPSEPVSVLQVHGTADTTILYDGGPGYPGARTTVADWATLNRCTTDFYAAAVWDLDTQPGVETIRELAIGCPPGVGVELWSMIAAPHDPAFSAWGANFLYNFLTVYPKPVRTDTLYNRINWLPSMGMPDLQAPAAK